MKVTNPYPGQQKNKLTRALGLDTLTGGTEGQGQGAERLRSAFSAEQLREAGATLAISLDALLGMWEAYVAGNRETLDTEFENLVGCIEEWRDAVPKA